MAKNFKSDHERNITSEKPKVKAEGDERRCIMIITANANDIIHLNVGGQKITTKRSTLCQVEGSFLASMFSGRWEDRLELDKDGCIFFDFNPKFFTLILDYLRAKSLETPSKPALLPKVASQEVMNFSSLLDYLGLYEVLSPSPTICVFGSHSKGINIEENGAVAVNVDNKHEFVLSKDTYDKGVMRWRLFLETFYSTFIFVGILNKDCSNLWKTSDSCDEAGSYQWNGSFGWTLDRGRNCQFVRNGKQSNLIATTDTIIGRECDIVELILDCTAGTLAFVLPSDQELNISLTKLAGWKLHIDLSGKGDRIRILSP